MENWKLKKLFWGWNVGKLNFENWKPENNNDWINNYENGNFGNEKLNLEIGILKILFKDGILKINE